MGSCDLKVDCGMGLIVPILQIEQQKQSAQTTACPAAAMARLCRALPACSVPMQGGAAALRALGYVTEQGVRVPFSFPECFGYL